MEEPITGAINTISNIGTSSNSVVGIFDSLVNKDLKLKKLEAGNGITLTATTSNTIRIASESLVDEIYKDKDGTKSSVKITDDGNNGNILFSVDNAEIMRVNQNGIGIGTTVPTEKLDVKGTIRYSGTSNGYIDIKAPASGGSATYTFPGVVGASQNGKYLKTDASGNLLG